MQSRGEGIEVSVHAGVLFILCLLFSGITSPRVFHSPSCTTLFHPSFHICLCDTLPLFPPFLSSLPPSLLPLLSPSPPSPLLPPPSSLPSQTIFSVLWIHLTLIRCTPLPPRLAQQEPMPPAWRTTMTLSLRTRS